MKPNIKTLLALIYKLFLKITSRKKIKRIILYYHGINAEERFSFDQQMRYLANHCNVVSLEKITDFNFTSNNNIVAITFDDAFANLISNAIPVLIELNLPATIFAPMANLSDTPNWNIHNNNCLDKQQVIMTENQLKELDEIGFNIQSHTMTHTKLQECTEDILSYEIGESKERLESVLDHEINAISYPHGVYTTSVIKKVKEAGYTYGYTILPKCVKKR